MWRASGWVRMGANFINDQHRRFNALAGEWPFVSPHRTRPPWQGRTDLVVSECRPDYDPNCYLCPGNVRANGEVNPGYDSTFVFANSFAAFLPETPKIMAGRQRLLRAHTHSSECRVICFSPRHSLTLAQMSEAEVRGAVKKPQGGNAVRRQASQPSGRRLFPFLCMQ